MFFDGLQNPYDGNMMGHFAEATAQKYGFTREAQDEFAITSVKRARAAMTDGRFVDEIAPVTVTSRNGEQLVSEDESPLKADIKRIPQLRPAFAKDGTVTAASSSSISDGAASLILMSEKRRGNAACRCWHASPGILDSLTSPNGLQPPPVYAINALHKKLGWDSASVDLYEINEAFACVTMAAMHDVGIDHAKVNVNGGACALGHPIGASGARIIVTLLHALRNRGGGKGIASLCIGGGEAVAIGIEIN